MAKNTSFTKAIDHLERLAYGSSELEVKQIVAALDGKGVPALIAVFILPAAFPVQIPGVSGVLGLLVTVLAFRIAFLSRAYCPTWLGKKTVEGKKVLLIAGKTRKWTLSLQKVIRPRLPHLVSHPITQRSIGIVIFLFAFFLALPLPFTNTLFGLPILILSLALLEEDFVFICIGIILSIFILLFSFQIVHFGIEKVFF